MSTAKMWIVAFVVGVMMMGHTVHAARKIERLLQVKPTAEVLREIADAVGAARFEEITVDSLADSSKSVSKLITPENPDSDIEYLTYQGVMGRPGIDFPVLPSIPHTSFDCKKVATGYYADLETDCQVFHICDGGRKISFLCPNGTIFRQSHLICDWWFKVDCKESPELYEESAEHLAADQRKRDRANKKSQNFDNILKTNKEQTNNFLSQSSNEYKAEASFTSVAQSAPVNNDRRGQKRNQERTTNSRPYSSFEHSTEEDSEARRQKNVNDFKFSTTRRTMSEYAEPTPHRTSNQARNSKETQIAEESASFANNRGRNNYYQYTTVIDSKTRSTAATIRSTKPTYTTNYVPSTKNYVEVSRSVSHSVSSTTKPTTATQPKLKEDPVSYSFVQYNQFPTTTVPHNHFKIATNHTRKGKGFSSTTFEKNSSQNKTIRNNYQLQDKTKSQPFYAPTVPTITPKPIVHIARTTPTYDNRFETTTPTPTTYYTTMPPDVSEHAIEMIKTLDELELGSVEPTTETEKILGRRPGLIVPPSAGPNTLHSLAIYFATAVDNLVSTPEPTTATEEVEEATEVDADDDSYSSLLSKKTIDKYTDLFKNKTEEEIETEQKNDVSNDLEVQQSRGPLTSSPQIRELAQVFTHALSAYLQDPETFRKVLSEIRPTDPTSYDISTTASNYYDITTPHNEYASVTKEEDEVLDFSDVSKTRSKSLRPTASYKQEKDKNVIKSTVSYQIESLKIKDKTPGSRYITKDDRQGKELTTPTPNNPIAQEINGLSQSNDKVPQTFSLNQNISDSYFPESHGSKYGGFQNNTDYSPYGAGVQPSNSTPISSTTYTSSRSGEIPQHWGDVVSTKPSTPNTPSYDLTPPDNNQNNKLDSVEMSVLNSFVPEDLNDLAVYNSTEYTTENPTQATEASTARYAIYNTESDIYDSKKINDNDEQLQRAHSQSFVSSKNQLNRRGKKIKTTTKDEDSNSTVTVRTSNGLLLSLPTLKDILSKPTSTSYGIKSTDSTLYDDPTASTVNAEATTNFEPSTTADYTDATYKPNSAGSTTQYNNIWSTSAALGHIWQTTVFLDPMTINDGLTGDISSESIQPSANTYYPRSVTQVWGNYDSTTAATEQTVPTYTTPVNVEDYTTTSPEEVTTFESKKIEDLPDHSVLVDNNEYFDQFKRYNQAIKGREGKSLIAELQQLNSSDVDNTMMSRAKEMFGGLNASSANTLMNVMKQADKNTTVRRLILLLIQTCDDDHNKTLEASRAALLDALIRFPVQEKETTYSREEETSTTINKNDLDFGNRRSDEIFDADDTKRPELPRLSLRGGKSYDVPTTIRPSTIPKIDTTTATTTTTTTTAATTTTTTTTTLAPLTKAIRRGSRKYLVKTSKLPVNSKQSFPGDSFSSGERGSTASLEDQSVPSDTRALELLRSLYSLAARWG